MRIVSWIEDDGEKYSGDGIGIYTLNRENLAVRRFIPYFECGACTSNVNPDEDPPGWVFYNQLPHGATDVFEEKVLAIDRNGVTTEQGAFHFRDYAGEVLFGIGNRIFVEKPGNDGTVVPDERLIQFRIWVFFGRYDCCR